MIGLVKFSFGIGKDTVIAAGTSYFGIRYLTRLAPGIGVIYGLALGPIASVVRRILDKCYPNKFYSKVFNPHISIAIATLPARAIVNYTGFSYLSIPKSIVLSFLVIVVNEIADFCYENTIDLFSKKKNQGLKICKMRIWEILLQYLLL